MKGYQPIKTLDPLNLLMQLAHRQFSGCLQISSGAATWLIYLQKGKLLYASNSIEPFERLDRHLNKTSNQVPTLAAAIRTQLRSLFATSVPSEFVQNSDYQVICWLVYHNHLNPTQAATLIQGLVLEVLQSLLLVREGTYQTIDSGTFTTSPKFCFLDIPLLAKHFQQQQSAKHSETSTFPTATSNSNSINSTLDYPEKKAYKIACIDDNKSVLQAINRFLENQEYSVVTISDPVKALMQILRCRPDLILLDVTMPNLDGYELCSLLRRHSSFKNTPIIMVTGNTGLIDRAKAKLVRSSDYLTKPFTQKQLLQMVRKHLR
jgi:two-component system, chemotaxis family, response regulator PixG